MSRAVARRHETGGVDTQTKASVPVPVPTSTPALAPSRRGEEQAGAQPAGQQDVQSREGVLAQLLARRDGALVCGAILEAVGPALVAAGAQLARVVLAVALAGVEALVALVPGEC